MEPITIHIRTASRLHFGVLSLGTNSEGIQTAVPHGMTSITTPRFWGGIGMMVESPGIELVARPTIRSAAKGPLAKRVLDTVKQIIELKSSQSQMDLQQADFHIISAAPEHVGLGTGTQLGLAVASALARINRWQDLSAKDLASLAKRGSRSAIGIHGFEQGGFLVDGGKQQTERVSSLVARHPFPEEWRVLLIKPSSTRGLHALAEQQAIQSLRQNADIRQRDRLCRLVLMNILPALVEQSFDEFSQALGEFNRVVGEMFVPVQKSVYAHPLGVEIVRCMKEMKLWGAGQSSWGPTMFAIASCQEQAHDAQQFLLSRVRLGRHDVLITRGANLGARITALQSSS